MIQFRGSKGDVPVIGVGLSRANMEALLAGKPILLDEATLKRIAPELPPFTISIIGGETEETMYQDMKAGGLLPKHGAKPLALMPGDNTGQDRIEWQDRLVKVRQGVVWFSRVGDFNDWNTEATDDRGAVALRPNDALLISVVGIVQDGDALVMTDAEGARHRLTGGPEHSTWQIVPEQGGGRDEG